MKRRDFVKTAAAAGVAGAVPRTLEGVVFFNVYGST